jgi:hypothetical protein
MAPISQVDQMLDINMHLKSEEMVDFLESQDLDVIYKFDRLDEGEEDSYSVICDTLGLELHFDAAQSCTTIFMADLDAVLEEGLVDFPDLRTPSEVEAYAHRAGLRLIRGASFLRCDSPERCIHYEFDGTHLVRVTVMSPAVAPPAKGGSDDSHRA